MNTDSILGNVLDCPDIVVVTFVHFLGRKPAHTKTMTFQYYLDHYYTNLDWLTSVRRI